MTEPSNEDLAGLVRDILAKLTEHDVLLATHSAELRHLGEEVERLWEAVQSLWKALQPMVDDWPNLATKQDMQEMTVAIIQHLEPRLDRAESRMDGMTRLLIAIALNSGVDNPESYLQEG